MSGPRPTVPGEGDKRGWGLTNGLMCQTASPRSKETRNEIPALLRAWKHFLKLCTLPTCHALPRGEEGLSDGTPHPLSLIKQEEGDQGLQRLSLHLTNSHKLQFPTQPGRAPDLLGPKVGLSQILPACSWTSQGRRSTGPKVGIPDSHPSSPPFTHNRPSHLTSAILVSSTLKGRTDSQPAGTLDPGPL